MVKLNLMNKQFRIYTIQNRRDLKIYVGQTNNPVGRWGTHKSVAKIFAIDPQRINRPQMIDQAIAQEGIDNFVFQVIEEWATQGEIDEAEGFWIEFFQSRKDALGYNRSPGGHGSRGWVHSADTRKRMSKGKESLPWPEDEVLLEMATRLTATKIGKQLSIDTGTVITAGAVCRKFKRMGDLRPMDGSRGPNHPNSKFSSEEEVLKIITTHQTGNHSQRELAKMFDASENVIHTILSGESYSHITGIQYQGSKLLSREKVLKIVELYKTGTYTHKELGQMFDVHDSEISAIMLGKIWVNITGITDPVYTPPRKGEDNKCAVLTNEQAIKIVELYKTGDYTHKTLAKLFDVGATTIQRITSGETWSSITGLKKPATNAA
jgi:group I intron endonuclease